MKLRFGIAAWISIGLLSGPAAVISVWAVAALAAQAGFVVQPGAAPRYAGPQGRDADFSEIYVTKEQSGGSIGLLKQIIAPKSGPPLHVHPGEDEFFYVLKGTFKLQVGDEIKEAPVGSMMYVPRGVAHTFQNAGSEPGEFLVGVTPGGFEGMMVDRVGKDAEAVNALAKKYNMEVVGSPIPK
jgi:quercetin dioxygenase-like cupin family protein